MRRELQRVYLGNKAWKQGQYADAIKCRYAVKREGIQSVNVSRRFDKLLVAETLGERSLVGKDRQGTRSGCRRYC
jgi:hypothetical protein